MSRLANLQFSVSFDNDPDANWQVVNLSLTESINDHYTASIEVETEDAHADTSDLLGTTCEVSMQRGEHPPRFVHGVVARVDYLGHHEHHVHARVTVVPAFALAKSRINSRIWQDMSVQDIVREVLANTLDEYGRSVEFGHLQRGLSTRDYCVQYRESDHDFVCRLLEEEGIAWFFVHDGERGHEVLTLCDDNEDYPKHANVDGTATLPIIAHNPDEADIESLQAFEWAQQLTTTSVSLSEFDAGSPSAGAADLQGEADARGRSRQIVDHGQRRFGTGELGQRAQDMQQSLRMSGSLATCESNASSARIGHRFMLDGANHDGTPSEWLVTSMLHDYGGDGAGGAQVYRNTLTCVPATVVIRPRELTPKPEVRGPQTATVVGGGEIDVDASGRIQVQFHWTKNPEQRGGSGGTSCRLRCAQSWAGPGWGAQFIPRVGMEVVVEFLEGNPDRPLVTGCVYNGANEPPFALPGNSTQSGWRSNSSPGGGGSNELRFEDAAGSEEIYLHGQKDWNTEIKHDKAQTVGNNESLRVGNNRRKSVQANETESIGANKNVTVGEDQLEVIGANMTLTVGVNQAVEIGADQSVTVGASRSESIGASATQTVLVAKTVTVGGMLATIVGGAMNTSVGAALLEEVGGIKTVAVGGASGESVVGPKSVDAASIQHSARSDLSATAGANVSVSAGKDMAITAKGELSIAGKKKGLIELESDLTIKVGKASITLSKNGEIKLEGTKISVKGKDSITLKAKKVNQN
ncbi:type VI secretion system Vgr family protein [Enhygromyxa salina]|uniref:Phage-related baseplate assembly protein n=1 Tax=Enhygromyxa salina TaxID=215803 RepID=A0A2S9YT65_9BACT|nr:type VI secretion system tip protein TssI/VgrG [Enhygromyxa salina]PRQ08260.1 Phage-related baseplate assembly protein [Enhygromyxa salina]